MDEPTLHTLKELSQRARDLIPGGVTSAARKLDLVFREASGAYLSDSDGRRYLDFHAAFGPVLLGHNHPAVREAVRQTLERGALTGAGVTELEIAVAGELHRHIPCAEKILLCTSGSEAVAAAIRLARGATARPKIIKFRGSYHGIYDSVLTGGHGAAGGDSRPIPDPAGLIPGVAANTLTCPYNSLESVVQALETHPGQVAAILVEPVGHSLGCILPNPGFLEGLSSLATTNGALLIFDEVITGFRHHIGGFQPICGVRPDLATFGKAIANGFPLAAVCGRADLMDRFTTHPAGDVTFAGTYHGHPAACAAALATLAILEREPVHARIYQLGQRIRSGLAEIHRRLGTGATVAGFGSIFISYFAEGPFESHSDAARNDTVKFVRYHRGLVERGVFLMPANLKRGHIGYAHTEADIDRALETSEAVLRGL